jgi:hypothetical protein
MPPQPHLTTRRCFLAHASKLTAVTIAAPWIARAATSTAKILET